MNPGSPSGRGRLRGWLARVLPGLCVAALGASSADAAPRRDYPLMKEQSPWSVLREMPAEALQGQPMARPRGGVALMLDRGRMERLLSQAPAEIVGVDVDLMQDALMLELPLQDGTWADFKVINAPVMEPELAERYPEIQTYYGRGVQDPLMSVRISMTPLGFSAQMIGAEGTSMIDPVSLGDDRFYTSYSMRQIAITPRIPCSLKGEDLKLDLSEAAIAEQRSGPARRTIRTVVGLPGEITQQYGGTVQLGLAGLVTSFTRVAQVYEREASVRLVLIGKQDRVIFTNAATDPYPTVQLGASVPALLQSVLDRFVGNTAYDLGHTILNIPLQGNANSIGNVCRTNKGRAYTGGQGEVPGSASLVFVLSHEIGHQCGANHAFNGADSTCFNNAWGPTAIEPGSGSSIMSYVGICGLPTNVNLDPAISDSNLYFNSRSFDEIAAYLGQRATCTTLLATSNAAPIVQAMPNVTIPARTPFSLLGSATDPNGDVLSYSWDQRNTSGVNTGGGPIPVSLGSDAGFGPLIRVLPPSSSSVRTIPAMSTVLDPSNPIKGEQIPRQSRPSSLTNEPLNFRLTARDGRGGINTADTSVSVVDTGAAFTITSPVADQVLNSGVRSITWAVANTDNEVFRSPEVTIRLSVDDGQTFPYVLSSATGNTGGANVTIPALWSNTARLRVESRTNVFFAVSPRFRIRPSGGPALALTGLYQVDDTGGNGNGNSFIDPGETSVRLKIQLTRFSAGTANTIQTTLTAVTPGIVVTQGSSSYPDLAQNAVGVNATNFVISVPSSQVCGAPIALQLSITSSAGSAVGNVLVWAGDPTQPVRLVGPLTYTYTGAAPIPDDDPDGVTTSVFVPTNYRILEARLRINGNRCTTLDNSATVGISHSYVGDLRASLTAPFGPTISLFDRPGGSDNNGNNFCGTIFRDDITAYPSIQDGRVNGTPYGSGITISVAPYSGTFQAVDSFLPLLGEDAFGEWQFNVADLGPLDTGTVRSWSLILTGVTSGPCAAPIGSSFARRIAVLSGEGLSSPEDLLTVDDFLTFMQAYAEGSPEADVTGAGGPPAAPDGQVTIDDVLAFLNAVAIGAPY